MATKISEQHDRMKRWYAKFESTDRDREHNVTSENYVDEIYAFFMNCYHLKDWIKNDVQVDVAVRKQVEDYISGNRPLSLCADLCNSLKHLVLTKPPRSGEGPAFGKKKYALKLGTGPARISLKYQVETARGPVDAFDLATECVAAWDRFMAENGLVHDRPTRRQ